MGRLVGGLFWMVLLRRHFLKQAGKAADDQEPGSSSTCDGTKTKGNVAKYLEGSAPEDVIVSGPWKKLLADDDDLIKAFKLKSRIGVGLQAMWDTLEGHGVEDLDLVNRRDPAKGTWTTEVWTKKPFPAHTLVLVPYSSSVKDTHLTAQHHAPVGMPATGRGKNHSAPGVSMSLDGRCRTNIAAPGSTSDEGDTGSLYWAVTRVDDPEQANLEFQTLLWNMELKVILPPAVKKARQPTKTSSWGPHELPTFQLLTNPQPLEKGVKLTVHIAKPFKKAVSG